MAKTNSCIDCGVTCDKRCQRCQSCSNKINGKSRDRHLNHCKKCGVEITKKKYKYCHACSMQERWNNEEYSKKTILSMRKSFDIRWEDPSFRKKVVKILTTSFGTSKLEKRVAKIGNQYGFQPSIVVGRYLSDLMHLDKKIIVEVNGDYWHCNPNLWKADELHPLKKMTAQEVWDKDNKREDYLTSLGYTICIIWEADIIKGKNKFIQNFFEEILK